MKKLLLFLQAALFSAAMMAQKPAEIKLSELFSRKEIPLFNVHDPGITSFSSYDTASYSFYVQNDLQQDTSFYITEGENEWVDFSAISNCDSCATISWESGVKFSGKDRVEYIYYAAQPVLLNAGYTYYCTIRFRSIAYFTADTAIHLLSPAQYILNREKIKDNSYPHYSVPFIFSAVIFFSFLFFLSLFIITRIRLFGWYLVFLFIQLLYGYLLSDITTWFGGLLPQRYHWEPFLSEPLIFIGEAIYLYFVTLWLGIRKNNPAVLKYFRGAIIFFIIYSAAFLLLFIIDKRSPFLFRMQVGVRIISFVFQIALFYLVIFKVRTTGRFYILAGNLLLMLSAVFMVLISEKGGFKNTVLENLSSGSWYMLGILCESFCFSMGMGLYYYQLQKENAALQVDRFMAKQLQMEAEEQKLKDRLRISQDLHDSIGSTLGSISIYSKVARIHEEKNEKEELQELLGKIGDTSNEMISDMNDIVWAINPRNDNMEKILQRMESYARPLLAARNIAFSFDTEPGVLLLQMEMEKRKNFYIIFKEAVTNAIKYSGASELIVSIQKKEEQLQLLVQDNGIGFNPGKELNEPSPSLSGNGLRNMFARAKDMNGNLSIDSTPGAGTLIRLAFLPA